MIMDYCLDSVSLPWAKVVYIRKKLSDIDVEVMKRWWVLQLKKLKENLDKALPALRCPLSAPLSTIWLATVWKALGALFS